MGYVRKKTNHDVSSAGSSDPTVQQIEDAVNKMDVDVVYAGYIVLDTNILLGYLEVIQQFIEDLKAGGMKIVFLIPGVVVQELDYQKVGNNSLAWQSRRAGRWIYEMLTREKNTLKGQAYNETCQASLDWKKRDRDLTNDDLILDCCLFYRQNRSPSVALISADYNMCIKAASQDITTVNPRDSRKWSSRELARKIFNYQPHDPRLAQYTSFVDTKRPDTVKEALDKDLGVQSHLRSDEMEIDDDIDFLHSKDPRPRPSHILDVLHYDIVDHFTNRLRDAVLRVSPRLALAGDPSLPRLGTAASQHSIENHSVSTWTAAECIQHLTSKVPSSKIPPEARSILNSSSGTRRLIVFLAGAYDGTPQTRRGQDWPRQEWVDCLGVLALLAVIWEDEAIQIDMCYLWTYVQDAFGQQMVPRWVGEKWYLDMPKQV